MSQKQPPLFDKAFLSAAREIAMEKSVGPESTAHLDMISAGVHATNCLRIPGELDEIKALGKTWCFIQSDLVFSYGVVQHSDHAPSTGSEKRLSILVPLTRRQYVFGGFLYTEASIESETHQYDPIFFDTSKLHSLAPIGKASNPFIGITMEYLSSSS